MKQLGIKYGVISGLFYIAVASISFMFELSSAGSMVTFGVWGLSFGLTFVIVYLAIKELREETGSMTAGQGLKLGVTIGLIAGAMAAVFTVIYTQMIDPSIITQQLEAAAEKLEDRGMSDADIEQAMSMSESLTSPYLTIPLTIIMYTIGGLIKGAIGGAILKQDAPV